MNLHRSGIDRECFDPDPHDLFQLQLLKHSVQYAVFRPAAHAHVDRVPAAEPFRKPAPLATLFRHIEHRVQHLQVGQTYVAALHRQAIFDARILLFRDLHPNLRLRASAVKGSRAGWRYTSSYGPEDSPRWRANRAPAS